MTDELTKVLTPDGEIPEPKYSPAKSVEKAAEQTGASVGALVLALVGVVLFSPDAQAAITAYAGNAAAVGAAFVVLRFLFGVIRDRAKHRGPGGALKTPR